MLMATDTPIPERASLADLEHVLGMVCLVVDVLVTGQALDTSLDLAATVAGEQSQRGGSTCVGMPALSRRGVDLYVQRLRTTCPERPRS